MTERTIYRKARERLNIEYDKALNNQRIRNPIAFALYQTWKEFDAIHYKGQIRKIEHKEG